MSNATEVKIAFYVSGGASRLLKLFEKQSDIVKYIKVIINDNKPNVILKEQSKKNGIAYHEFSYSELGLVKGQRNLFISEILLKYFLEYQIDYCFCFGDKLLKGKILQDFKNKIINFHPSILPSFPGQKSIDKALEENAFLIGNTAHFITNDIDKGPIIMQSIIHRNQFKTYEDVLCLQIQMIEQIFQWLVENRIRVDSENNVKVINANYNNIAFFPPIEYR